MINLNSLIEEYKDKSFEQLCDIQKETLFTIKPALNELSNHINQNVNQIFFLMCVLSCIEDKKVDEDEFKMIHQYINQRVTYTEFQQYALSINDIESLENLLVNFISVVRQFSKDSKDEFIKFMLTIMMCKHTLAKEERVFLDKLIDDDKIAN